MKKSIKILNAVAISLGFAFSTAQADEVGRDMVYKNDATFSFCLKDVPGCPLIIHIDDRPYTVAMNQGLEVAINDTINSYRFHRLTTTEPFRVVGFRTREKGYYPRPDEIQDVFHLVSIERFYSIK